jgi:hypothetical protein
MKSGVKVLALVLLLVLVNFLARQVNKGQSQASSKSSAENAQVDPFYRDLKGPGGNWSVSVVPDSDQSSDPAIPVAVDATRSFIGKGQYRGVKVTGATIRNRSANPVRAMRLKWMLCTLNEARDQILILNQGQTEVFTAAIPGGGEKALDFPIANFAKIADSLVKDGALTGEFRIFVGVSEVKFDNGLFWKDEEKESSQRSVSVMPYSINTCPKTVCDGVGGCNQDTWPQSTAKCELGPCNQYGCNCAQLTCHGTF